MVMVCLPSFTLAVSGPLAPPPPQAVSVRAAAMAAAPPILFSFLMVFPSIGASGGAGGSKKILGRKVVRRFMNHQHVLINFPVRIKAGELLVRRRHGNLLQGLHGRRRRRGFQGRFECEAFFLP